MPVVINPAAPSQGTSPFTIYPTAGASSLIFPGTASLTFNGGSGTIYFGNGVGTPPPGGLALQLPGNQSALGFNSNWGDTASLFLATAPGGLSTQGPVITVSTVGGVQSPLIIAPQTSSGSNAVVLLIKSSTTAITLQPNGATNLSLNLVSKGSGTVQVNGSAIAVVDSTAGDYVAMPTSWNQAVVVGATGKAADAGHSHGTMLDPLNMGMPVAFTPWNTSVTAWPNANQACYMRIEGSGTISNFNFAIGTASGNIDIGVYNNSGAGTAAVPGTAVARKGSTACPAAGLATVAVGSSNTVVQGQHWFALAADNTTVTVNRVSLGSAGLGMGFSQSQATAFPLPAPAGSTNNNVYDAAIIGS